MTRFLSTVFLLLTLSAPCMPFAAQGAFAGQATSAAQAPADVPPSTSPTATSSAILGPGLENLKQALTTLRPEKWKASGAITGEVAANIESIRRDLDETLPPLLSAADASPSSVPQMLPVYRNIEALYDVLVRVAEVSTLAAPGPQSAALQQATTSLQAGRRELGDHLQSAAQSEDHQLSDLQSKLRTIQATPAPPAPVCPPPPAPVKKTKPRPKPAVKPTQPSVTAPASSPSTPAPNQ